jgi:3-oxoadipyl-CoA thiolase
MTYQRRTKEQLARRVARDIHDGAYVNLGIGMPTLVANHLPQGIEVALQSENGILGMGPAPAGGDEDYDLINAGKQPVTLLTGGSYFHHADSFAMMRGGHLDICVLGAFQVSVTGDLANWHTGEKDAIPAVGGAMDLAIGAKQTWVMMDLLTKKGESKVVERCSYPLTGIACVKRIYSDLATLECSPQGLKLIDKVDGLGHSELEQLIGLPSRPDPETNMTRQAFICDAIRTPFGRYGGALSAIRTDDLGAIPLQALMRRNARVDWQALTDVIYGCANQAGEDNRNVAHMASLLAGLPIDVPGATINRLCGSGLDAIGTAARAIKAGEATLMIAGGVESMSRAPFVMPKAESAFSRQNAVYDTTIGWRFVNKKMKELYGVDSMPETAENVATDHQIGREAQDAMAFASQRKAVAAQQAGFFDSEITPVTVSQKKGDAIVVSKDEHPRETSMESLAKLKGVVRPDGTVTAGNASGVNDGSCALLLADEATAARQGLTPRARVVGMATAGVPPRVMGIGPAPATQKVLALTGLSLAQMDVIELNEAFAAQGLAVLRMLGLQDDDPRVNPNGGAIALGHPLGASGARLATTAVNQLHKGGGRYALCSMCIGVGQGIALVLERV